MSLSWLSNNLITRNLHHYLITTTTWPLLIYATTWVTLLTLTVAVASFSPEVAFVSAITPSSPFSNKCKSSSIISNTVIIRVPLDFPGDIFCFHANVFVKKTNIDLIIPPIFAAVIVAASACFVRAVGLWEHDQNTPHI